MLEERIGNILFVVAGVLWAVELIPQLIKTIRTKSVKDISLLFLTLCFVAYLIFISGCYFIGNWFLFFSQLIPFVNVCILLYLVLKYKKKAQYFPPNNTAQAAWIVDDKCINNGKYICNLGYACDACPYNKEKK